MSPHLDLLIDWAWDWACARGALCGWSMDERSEIAGAIVDRFAELATWGEA